MYQFSFKKACLQNTGECSHSLMMDRPSNSFEFIEDPELEKRIFKRVYNREDRSIDDYINQQSSYNKFIRNDQLKRVQSGLQKQEQKTENLSDDHSENDENLDGSRFNDEEIEGLQEGQVQKNNIFMT